MARSTLDAHATIKTQWEDENARRDPIIDRARRCAELSKPHYLPPRNHDPNRELPENYQSIGSRGISNMEGRLLTALFPPGTPWFRLEPTAEAMVNMDEQARDQAADRLYQIELLMLAALESGARGAQRAEGRSSFYTAKRLALGMILVTGDVLEHFDDDYRLRVFRRDQYVTKRNSAGDVLFHITKESIDPLSLSDEQLAKADLDPDELADKKVSDRMEDLYTKCEWQPRSKDWLIEQEVNGEVINTSTEPVTPYLSTPYELAPGEHYGRGFIEANFGDIRSRDELGLRMLELASVSSTVFNCLDYAAETNEEDMQAKTGSTIRARVIGGVVDDVAFLNVNKLGDFGVVREVVSQLDGALGAAMLLGGDTVRDSERTTATEVREISVRELQGALGGVYASVAERQQVPLLDRLLYQMQRDQLIPTLPRDLVAPKVLTGIAALQRQEDLAKAQTFLELMRGIDPEMRMVKFEKIASFFERALGMRDSLAKTPDEIRAEQQQAARDAIQQRAAEQTIESAGAIAEAQATQSTEGAA